MKKRSFKIIRRTVCVFALISAVTFVLSSCSLDWKNNGKENEENKSDQALTISKQTDYNTSFSGSKIEDTDFYFVCDPSSCEQTDVNASEWLFGSSAKVGDKSILVSEEDGAMFYSVALLTKTRYPQKVATYRQILFKTVSADYSPLEDSVIVAKNATADSVIENWDNSEKEEAFFSSLAEKYSEDSSTNTSGGLCKGIVPGKMAGELREWLFDSSRKHGDVEKITTGYGIYIVYFSGIDYEYESLLMKDCVADKYEDYIANAKATGNYDIVKKNTTPYNYTSDIAAVIGNTSVTCSQFSLSFAQSFTQLTNYTQQYDAENASSGITLGFDPNKALDAQYSPDGETWLEYLVNYTLESYRKMLILCSESAQSGVKITNQELSGYIEKKLAEAGFKENETEKYLAQTYSPSLTVDVYNNYVKQQLIAEEYYDILVSEFEKNTDKSELKAEYEKNKDAYDTVDLRMLTFGNALTQNPDESTQDFTARQNKANEKAMNSAKEMFTAVTDEASFLKYSEKIFSE